MTKITFFQAADGRLRSVDILGHAGYAEEGEDIVCAAISSAVMLTHAFLEDIRHLRFDTVVEDEGAHIRISLPEGIDAVGTDALRALRLHFSELEENYPNYINVMEVQL